MRHTMRCLSFQQTVAAN